MAEPADHNQAWKAPRELSWAPPRPVSLTGTGVALVFVVVMLMAGAAAVAIGLGRVSAKQAADERRLREQGIQTTGVVTGQTLIRGKNRRYRVTYEFEYQGRGYHGALTISPRSAAALPEGGPVQVRFLPSTPARNEAIGWEPRPLPPALVAILTALLVGLAGLVAMCLHKQRKLLEEGRTARGVISRFSRVKGGKLIHYDFPLLNGTRREGHSGPVNQVPPVGTAICVLYDPDHPGRNAPYPLNLVRINAER